MTFLNFIWAFASTVSFYVLAMLDICPQKIFGYIEIKNFFTHLVFGFVSPRFYSMPWHIHKQTTRKKKNEQKVVHQVNICVRLLSEDDGCVEQSLSSAMSDAFKGFVCVWFPLLGSTSACDWNWTPKSVTLNHWIPAEWTERRERESGTEKEWYMRLMLHETRTLI